MMRSHVLILIAAASFGLLAGRSQAQYSAATVLTASLIGAETPAKPKLLFQASDVANLASDSKVCLLDCRSKEDFEAGHLPGAVWVDAKAWKDQSSKEQGMTAKEEWSQLISSLGIGNDSTVVVYGEPMPEVARIWWLLKYCGCKDARILDGGSKAWIAQGGTLSKEARHISPATFQVNFDSVRLATDADVQKNGVELKKCQILDNRAPGEFDGTVVRGKRGGHIPGATNLEWSQFLDADGKFLPADVLEQKIKEAGIDLDGSIIAHCQTGGRSSVGAFVLESLTGKPIANYYRGWSEWSEKDDLPIDK